MSEELEIKGYASLFDVRDHSGDAVKFGAFKASLIQRPPRSVRMLFQHGMTEPVGIWDEIREDERGLFVRGRIQTSSPRGEVAHRVVKDGAVDGLSIGFRTKDYAVPNSGFRDLFEIDLWEISIVSFPMLTQARLKVLNPCEVAA